ncbi:hypothetical protein [Staphylococcus epidermidis]|uniref:hypothetical protein n=1 Tax=Staphylococcus epidermidis TaxID=1282 RepID=UPI001642AD7C
MSEQGDGEGNDGIDINFCKDEIDRNRGKRNIMNGVNESSGRGISMNWDNDLDRDMV